MPRAFTNNTPDDVLETFRRIITGENSDEASSSSQPTRVQATQGPDRAPNVAILDTQDCAPTTPAVTEADLGVSAGGPSSEPVLARPEIAPSSGLFVDRIATRLSFPAGPGSSPVLRESVSDMQGDLAPEEDPAREPPMLLTRAFAVPSDTTQGRVSATTPAAAEPKLCKLLLTSDFQVRGPERSRLPHPVAPLARDDYVEDSDLSLDGDGVADMTPAAAALRETVGQALRSALRAEVGALIEPPQPETPERADQPEDRNEIAGAGASDATISSETPTLIDDGGYIDADMLQRLVVTIVRDELRGDLGDEMSRRIRKLVRLEINRMLQVRALD